jgi:adenosine deaminase
MNEVAFRGSKAELHCHCDGVVDPAMLRELAGDGMDLEATATTLESAYPVTSLDHWMSVYETALTEFWIPLSRSMRLVAMAQRERWRRQNVMYGELFISRMLGADLDGEPLREWFRALAADLHTSGNVPEVQILVCLSRTKVARQADRIIDLANAGLIAGIAIAGDERACSIRDIQKPIERIRRTGMGIEIHAGEMSGPESVWDALIYGRPDRIGHGVRAFEDPLLVECLASRQVHLEFCPTSNLKLGVIGAIKDLPIRQSLAAGIEFSINTDDPGVFQCSLTSELALVQEEFSLLDSDLERMFQNSMRAAFRRHSPSAA